jgi:hypothetical protein
MGSCADSVGMNEKEPINEMRCKTHIVSFFLILLILLLISYYFGIFLANLLITLRRFQISFIAGL